MAEPNQAPSDQPRDAGAAAQQALDAAQQAVSDLKADAGAPPAPLDLPVFNAASEPPKTEKIDLLADVTLNVKIELGRTRMLVEDVLRLSNGAVVELDKVAGDPVDVYVNERHVARGEVLVLNDNFCVRINEIMDPNQEERKAG